jgi:hypothetical protein
VLKEDTRKMSMRLSVGMAFSEERAFPYGALIGHCGAGAGLGSQDDLPMRYYTEYLYVWCVFPFSVGAV